MNLEKMKEKEREKTDRWCVVVIFVGEVACKVGAMAVARGFSRWFCSLTDTKPLQNTEGTFVLETNMVRFVDFLLI